MTTTPLRIAALLCSALALMALSDPLSAQRRGGGGNAAERTTRLVDQFDADGNGYLDAEERTAAREWLRESREANAARGGGRGRRRGGRAGGRRGGRGGRGGGGRGGQTPPPELPKTFVEKDQVTSYPDHELYDNTILRTIFLDFPQPEWMAELDDFYRTDVQVPAAMTVDGVTYENVGTAFRGNSSYFAARGPKKSMNITTDFMNPGQRLYGYKTLNLLSGHADQSFLREVIHSEVGNRYFPVLKANLVKLVINGENWGVYVNVQQYNKDFLADAYDTKRGVRWKIPSGGGGALTYQGDDRAPYERSYQLKSDLSEENEQEAWQSLINLCRALEQTSDSELEQLADILDIDATLWFMAMEFAIMDGDGYFSRGSDYTLYQDRYGRFRPVIYDSNEVLGRSSGRGGGGARPPTVDSAPLALAEVEGRPLTRLFDVPSWRARYLAHVRTLAQSGMDWDILGPFVARQAAMIDAEVKIDDKALYGYDRFVSGVADLEGIVRDRREALLSHESLGGAWPEISNGSVQMERSAGDDEATVHVQATVGGEAAVSSVILYVSDRLTRPYEAIPMHDDGAHGDGAAGDGVYGAEAGTFDIGDDLLFYVEARAGTDRTAFHPASAEGRPMVVEVGGG